MKKTVLVILGLSITFCLGFLFKTTIARQSDQHVITKQTYNNDTTSKENNMKLGAFSVSLNVKDLKTSQSFYEDLGFKVFAGSMQQNYLIMKNGNALIGLFQGMFQGNMLTFNPGWDENAQNLEQFDDIRVIQQHLKGKNIKLSSEADEHTKGPASLMLTDPDGNVILLDQHR